MRFKPTVWDFSAEDDVEGWARVLRSVNGSEIARLSHRELTRAGGYEIDCWLGSMMTDWRERETS